MLAVCTLIIAIGVRNSVRRGYSLAESIRGSGGMMRKVMLVVQTVICTVFISGSLSLLQFVAGEGKLNHIPDNDRYYRQCVLVKSYMVSDRVALHRDLQNSRFAQQVIPYSESFENLNNDPNDPMGKLLNDVRLQSLRNYHMPDTSLLDFYRIRIDWTRMPEPGESYVLMSEGYADLYSQAGVQRPDMSSTSDGRILPVLGTYAIMPYSRLRSERISIVVVSPDADPKRKIPCSHVGGRGYCQPSESGGGRYKRLQLPRQRRSRGNHT